MGTHRKYLETLPRNNCIFAFINILSITISQNTIWAAPWYFQQCGMCDQQSLRSACAYTQSDQSLWKSFEYSMSVRLLTEHHLEFRSLKEGCTGSSESIHVKMPHSKNSRVTAQLCCKLPLNTSWDVSNEYPHYLFLWRFINPLKPNGISFSYQLDQSIQFKGV